MERNEVSVITMETVGQNFYPAFCFGMKRKNKPNCVSAACTGFTHLNCNASKAVHQIQFRAK